jgi:hypothetical protein
MLGDGHRGESVVLGTLQPGCPPDRYDEDETESEEQQANPVIRAPMLHLPVSRT